MKNYIKYSVILCLISLLQGCEALSMISSMVPSTPPGIAVDAQLGDKSVDVVGKAAARDIVLDDGGTVKIDSRTTNNGVKPFWILLGLVLWQLPKLTHTIGGIHAWFKSSRK